MFVGDLAPDVTDYVLQEHFRQYFPSVRSAKVCGAWCLLPPLSHMPQKKQTGSLACKAL